MLHGVLFGKGTGFSYTYLWFRALASNLLKIGYSRNEFLVAQTGFSFIQSVAYGALRYARLASQIVSSSILLKMYYRRAVDQASHPS
jgi:hypothetical protein